MASRRKARMKNVRSRGNRFTAHVGRRSRKPKREKGRFTLADLVDRPKRDD